MHMYTNIYYIAIQNVYNTVCICMLIIKDITIFSLFNAITYILIKELIEISKRGIF